MPFDGVMKSPLLRTKERQGERAVEFPRFLFRLPKKINEDMIDKRL